MATLSRFAVQAASAGCVAAVLLWTGSAARSQQPVPEPVLPGASNPYAADDRLNDTRLPRVAEQLPQLVASKDWDTLAHALQSLLDVPQGTLLHERRKDAAGRPYVYWYSPHLVANTVLSTLSDEALKVYNGHYGAVSSDLLTDARKKNDVRLFAEVAQRYLYTPAGPEALALLAAEYVEAGQLVPAALCYRRLLAHPKADPKAFAFYQAAVVFRKVGDSKHAEVAWKRLQKKLGKGTLSIEGQKRTARQIRSALERIPPLSATGNAQARGGLPDLSKRLWQRATFMDRMEETGEVEQGQELKPYLARALKRRAEQTDRPILPGCFPLAIGDKVVYRTYLGVTAVTHSGMKDNQGKVFTKPGDIEWKSTPLEGSLALLFNFRSTQPTLAKWAQTYEQLGLSELLFANPLASALSADRRYVYVVDDLALPPPPGKQFFPQGGFIDLASMARQNSLWGFERDTGKSTWRLGGSDQKDGSFSNTLWTGPPLPLGDTIYALNETNSGVLRLICIDPAKRGGKILLAQPLARVQERITGNIWRRTQPAYLAYRDGILVCPTNAGAVLGVDLATQNLRWGYTYRKGKVAVPPQPRLGKPLSSASLPRLEWRNAAPMIADGKVVFTAPDEGSIHCLNLRVGALVWRTPKHPNDLYLACVHGNAVVLVGKTSCRALDLASGKELWKLDTGVPSGMGAASGDTYYLPLRSTPAGKQPAVCAIDMAKGRIVRFIAAGKEMPGNLLFHAGQLISQGPITITAYPVRKDGRK